jgi:hypothetical protein
VHQGDRRPQSRAPSWLSLVAVAFDQYVPEDLRDCLGQRVLRRYIGEAEASNIGKQSESVLKRVARRNETNRTAKRPDFSGLLADVIGRGERI